MLFSYLWLSNPKQQLKEVCIANFHCCLAQASPTQLPFLGLLGSYGQVSVAIFKALVSWSPRIASCGSYLLTWGSLGLWAEMYFASLCGWSFLPHGTAFLEGLSPDSAFWETRWRMLSCLSFSFWALRSHISQQDEPDSEVGNKGHFVVRMWVARSHGRKACNMEKYNSGFICKIEFATSSF